MFQSPKFFHYVLQMSKQDLLCFQQSTVDAVTQTPQSIPVPPATLSSRPPVLDPHLEWFFTCCPQPKPMCLQRINNNGTER